MIGIKGYNYAVKARVSFIRKKKSQSVFFPRRKFSDNTFETETYNVVVPTIFKSKVAAWLENASVFLLTFV